MANEHDGGISDRLKYAVEAQIFRQYGLKELAAMSEEKSKPAQNQHTHHYTCLPTPPELEQFGLTHMVCRVDMTERPVAAFNSSAAASNMCDSLNGFAQQDRPELDVDVERKELDEANKLAEEREKAADLAKKIEDAKAKQTATVDVGKTLQQKVEMAQAAAATKK